MSKSSVKKGLAISAVFAAAVGVASALVVSAHDAFTPPEQDVQEFLANHCQHTHGINSTDTDRLETCVDDHVNGNFGASVPSEMIDQAKKVDQIIFRLVHEDLPLSVEVLDEEALWDAVRGNSVQAVWDPVHGDSDVAPLEDPNYDSLIEAPVFPENVPGLE